MDGGWCGRSRVKSEDRLYSLELFGWTVAAMSEAIAKRVADTGQASRADCEWSHRWQTERPEEWGRRMATVYSKGLACVFVFWLDTAENQLWLDRQTQKPWQPRSRWRPAGEPIMGSGWAASGWNECSRNETKGVELAKPWSVMQAKWVKRLAEHWELPWRWRLSRKDCDSLAIATRRAL